MGRCVAFKAQNRVVKLSLGVNGPVCCFQGPKQGCETQLRGKWAGVLLSRPKQGCETQLRGTWAGVLLSRPKAGL